MTTVHNVESIPAEQLTGAHRHRKILALWSDSTGHAGMLLPYMDPMPEDAEFRTVQIRSIEHDPYGNTTVTVAQEWGETVPLDYESTDLVAVLLP